MPLSDLEDNAIAILNKMPTRDGEMVRRTLRTVLPLYPDLAGSVTEEQLEQAARRIEQNLSISVEDAAKIQLPFDEWLPAKRGAAELWYYTRYRRWLENESGRTRTVLGVLDKDTDKIVGLLEDPAKLGHWKRRGLVVGHVQSGKTANYSGVLCKAADYGYRFIVLLTGMQEDLRVQTQERIEEGFVGFNTEIGVQGETKIGVGYYGLQRRPLSLTTRDDDFKISQARLPVSLQSVAEPLIVVTKKNARILENLIGWLRKMSLDTGGSISSVAMLLIDDEADNASVNTAARPSNPTSINRLIRELLGMFDRNAYVGYTATPFANIFIDPEAIHGENEDIFPRHFIVSLDAPTNYVGASRVFLPDGDLNYCLEEVNDHTKIIPENHKIDQDVQQLPPSLYKAIRVFVLVRAIRILRGQGQAHSSMLVNITRFNDVQTKITGLINDYLNRLRFACLCHAALPFEEALKDGDFHDLYATWLETYEGNITEDWDDIQGALSNAVSPIEVRKINSKSPDNLAYRKYKKSGLHVIAVGGLALSRGFTLEGLAVSYFLRNSQMYDTLLQMGRWFGYRDGFEDLCRIFMTREAIRWYAHISEASDELREEFRIMGRTDKTPEDFGLKVLAHPTSLIVTARNKMRTGKVVRHRVLLGCRLIETAAIRVDPTAIQRNRDALVRLVRQLDPIVKSEFLTGLGHVWTKVPASVVRDFVNEFRNHDEASPNTQAKPVTSYIEAREQIEMPLWDVCLFSRVPDDETPISVGAHQVWPQLRSATLKAVREGNNYMAVSGKSSRVASRGHEKAGMTPEEMKLAEVNFEETDPGKQISDRAYRRYRHRPLLMLHVLNVEYQHDGKEDKLNNVVAWGISFPDTKVADTEVEYVVNTKWWNDNFGDDIDEYEEEVDG